MEETIHGSSVTTEANFDISELFFSITGTDSTILSGNEIFVRISGYTKEELIGSFHNIIRHPDMPRIIFKTLWDYLNAGRPIVAYVKNRAKNGDYYWVLAVVFPLCGRYVSIRIKPTTQIFTAVKELYAELLSTEDNGGIEESGRILSELLNATGYESYDNFMSDALLQELRGRLEVAEAVPIEEKSEADFPLLLPLKTMHGHVKTLQNEYNRWFEKIGMFTQVKSMFEEKSLILRQIAREIVFLSLNASVASYKVAGGGETFGILARDIRTNAKENDILIGQIDTLSNRLSDLLNAIIFSVAGIRLQTETISYFIEELLCKKCNVGGMEIGENIEVLVALISEYSVKADTLQTQIDQQIQESLTYLDQLEKQMMYLGYIQVYGIIEAAGNVHETVNFEGIFSQLKVLIQTTSAEMMSIRKMAEHFRSENRSLMHSSIDIDAVVTQLKTAIVMIKN